MGNPGPLIVFLSGVFFFFAYLLQKLSDFSVAAVLLQSILNWKQSS